MSENIQAVRGMNDLLPDSIGIWHYVESVLREIAWQYGYQEIRTPVLEKTVLFKQSIGDQTDIVEKEMYTFADSGSEILSLRPEATASTVRACIQHGILHNKQQRLWYMGPMFRRERPQKGRSRQFHQFGIEAFGWAGPDMDCEIICVAERIWKNLKVDGITLEINTLGSEDSRLVYRKALTAYLSDHAADLDADSIRRLENNPMRILDSKIQQTQSIIAGAPNILDFLKVEEGNHFNRLCENLERLNIEYRVNPKLVRGLDYYTSTVFEWTTDQLGAQAAVCAGGRYDSLVGRRGGKPIPAIGFAMGMERLIELLAGQNHVVLPDDDLVYLIDVTSEAQARMVILAEQLRDQGHRAINHCGNDKLKTQLKRADRSGAKFAMIFGDAERKSGIVQFKYLRENTPAINLPLKGLLDWCDQNLKKHTQYTQSE